MKQNRWTSVLSWAVLFCCLWFGYNLFLGNMDELKSIEIDYAKLPMLILSCLYTYFVRGQMQQALVFPYDVSLSLWEQMGLTTVTTIGNMIFPANAGMVYKMMYLKKIYHIDWVVTGFYLAVSWVFITISDALLALSTLILMGEYFSFVTLVFFLISICCISFLFTPSDLKIVRRLPIIDRAFEGWGKLKKKPEYAMRIMLVSVFLSFGNTFVVWSSCQFVGINISWGIAIILGSVRSISTYFILTPGSLGITEVFLASSAKLIGLTSIEGVIISAIFRLGMLGVGLILSPIFYMMMNKKMTNA